ncbi:hypothetical protein V0288_01790 [Pannus brasiliensis CCIBt3594]|uniref:Uncharacterized protein n=1 Tax=Pannus brasiliensis CCIBt3594 TaxID=1427578 RepID=A0AAW9QFE3_9CHRO
MNLQPSTQAQPSQTAIAPAVPIDTNSLLDRPESPTAIILAIAVLLVLGVQAMTGLIEVILRSRK